MSDSFHDQVWVGMCSAFLAGLSGSIGLVCFLYQCLMISFKAGTRSTGPACARFRVSTLLHIGDDFGERVIWQSQSTDRLSGLRLN